MSSVGLFLTDSFSPVSAFLMMAIRYLKHFYVCAPCRFFLNAVLFQSNICRQIYD